MIYLLSAVYSIYLLVFLIALYGAIIRRVKKQFEIQEYTVVIAARDEEGAIGKCLAAILNQSKPPQEIIVVNDHSDDQTSLIVSRMALDAAVPIRLYEAPHNCNGKKQCLVYGITQAAHSVILTTDADCASGHDWANMLLQCMGKGIRLISSPVLYNKAARRAYMQAEYLGLVAFAAAFGKIGRPSMISGASMAFFRDDFIAFSLNGHGHRFLSGDDIFFMQYIEKKYGSAAIYYQDAVESLVFTDAPKGIAEWLGQRYRWASKSVAYKGAFHWFLPMIIALVNLIWLLALFGLMLGFSPSGLLVIVVLLKPLIESLLPLFTAIQWKQIYLVGWFPIVSILYPLYLVGVLLSGIINPPTWKGRPLKQA